MPQDRLNEQLAFLMEIDALKSIVRQSPLRNLSRHENSAEHSWHLAMFALVLADDRQVDTAKVIAMLLVHDIVEIDAGDAPIHGQPASDLQAQERAAADRLFGMPGGGTWTENAVSEQHVYERYGPTIERGCPSLWARARMRCASTLRRLVDSAGTAA